MVELDPADERCSPVHVQVDTPDDVWVYVGRESGFIALWEEPEAELLKSVSQIVEAQCTVGSAT